jgi:Xaa-Pro aminopeptidase
MPIDSERHARTTAELLTSSHNVLLCSSATEVLLLSGYWPVMSASVAVFSSDGEVNVILPEDEVELAEQTTSAKLLPYKPENLHTLEPPVQQLRKPLKTAMTSMGLEKAAIGMQLHHGIQPSSYAVSNEYRTSLPSMIHELFPGASVASCDGLLEKMKATKTPKELAMLRLASQVASEGFTAAATSIKAGVRESVVAAQAQEGFEQSSCSRLLQRSYGYYFCMSGPNSAKAAAAYARTRQRVMEEGDLVMIHANTCADGYWTDITRTFTVGEPSARQEEMRSAIDEARAAGLQAIRPGIEGAEVDAAVRGVMEAHGLGKAFKHAAGHGVGFAAANPNGRPRIHPCSHDVLQAGMTFNLEPAAYFDGYGGMRHCDVIAVTHNGAEVITDF